MPSLCFYFQVHQPFRILNRSALENDPVTPNGFFDEVNNKAIMLKVAKKCYLPTNFLMLDLIRRHKGEFRISYSISGVALEQMQKYAPEVIDSFQLLSETGCVEFLSETYHHSLSAVYDLNEFKTQVEMHDKLIKRLFNCTPKVFRNTELIYEDKIGAAVAGLGYKAMIAEGADDILQWRSPNFVYNVAGTATKLLLKNYKLSDDIAFRFSNKSWEEYPLSADKFAHWVKRISGNGETLNLFMDYETFGEHQWESTGIFEFLEHLPSKILELGDWNFKTPSEVIESYNSVGDLHFGRLTSWADVDRDLTAWNGNHMQRSAINNIYLLKSEVFATGDAALIETWRKLLTSDHFYYMCTKWFADGDVHAYFSPFESPYDAFIAYMNVFRAFRHMVKDSQNHSNEKTTFAKVQIV